MSTASQGQVVAAFFDKQSDAENAIRDLQAAGFRSDQIGSSFEDLDQEDYAATTENSNRSLTSDQYSPNSATSSVSAHHESFWDKVKDFFSGETTDSDINDHTTTDREYAHVSDRAYAGGWNGGMLIPDRYRDRINRGGGLVTVHASDRLNEAQQILKRNHGEIDQDSAWNTGTDNYVRTPGSWTGDTAAGMGQGTRADITGGTLPSDYNTFGGSETAVPSAINANAEQRREREADLASSRAGSNLSDQADLSRETPERRIQLVSEVLRVRKERVNRGEVRLRKEVRTETQNVQVPVTREEIVIERTPVKGEKTATGKIGADKEIRVPLSEERAQIEKVPVVREEVKVGKRTVASTQNLSDQVRREELEVEGADEKLRDPSDRKRKTA
jgi:uncharacterized protein (TIGR02271 family)